MGTDSGMNMSTTSNKYGKTFQKENILKTHRKKEHSFTAFHKVVDARSMKMNPSVSGNYEKGTENEA